MVCFSTDWADKFQFSLLLLRVSKCLLFFFLSGPWKRACLADFGIVTQCLSPLPVINDQYVTNLLLKINAKVFHTAIIDTVTGYIWLSLVVLVISYHNNGSFESLACFLFLISLAGWTRCWKWKRSMPYLSCHGFQPWSLAWMFPMVPHNVICHPLLR